jgi:hypothetical protein
MTNVITLSNIASLQSYSGGGVAQHRQFGSKGSLTLEMVAKECLLISRQIQQARITVARS